MMTDLMFACFMVAALGVALIVIAVLLVPHYLPSDYKMLEGVFERVFKGTSGTGPGGNRQCKCKPSQLGGPGC